MYLASFYSILFCCYILCVSMSHFHCYMVSHFWYIPQFIPFLCISFAAVNNPSISLAYSNKHLFLALDTCKLYQLWFFSMCFLIPGHRVKEQTLGHGFFFFFFFNLFLFMAVLGLRFCARAFSSCGEWGPLFIAVRGPLTIAASLVAEHRLQTHRLSSCGSQA